jgi:ArsR family transcriptional regulator
MQPTSHDDADALALMRDSSGQASRLLKALSNQDRLMILCILADGEKCVSELERLLGIRQPTLSQQLARLRADDLVSTRRDGKVVHYSLASSEAGRLIELLYQMYCAPAMAERASAAALA